MYLFYDGNKIGDIFEGLILQNDIQGLRELSVSLSAIHLEIYQTCINMNSKVIEAGGDEGLLECVDTVNLIEKIEAAWRAKKLEVAIGIGSTPAAAYQSCLKMKEAANER